MTSSQFKEPDFGRDRYLKFNAEHVVVRDVVWTQGWSRPDFRGGEDEIVKEGGVREYVRGEVGLEEVRRGINYKIIEGKVRKSNEGGTTRAGERRSGSETMVTKQMNS